MNEDRMNTTEELRTRTGGMHLEFDRVRGLMIVSARGHIGPKLALWDLDRAEAFGRTMPDGWWYLVDTGAVTMPNPVNLRLVPRIHRLPNIRGYVVIAPKAPLRAIARGLRVLSGPDAVVRTREEALALVQTRRGTPT